jgi:hypothetical protein
MFVSIHLSISLLLGRFFLIPFSFSLDTHVFRGVRITNPTATFAEIDRDHGGMILFEEFADWAIHQHLASV